MESDCDRDGLRATVIWCRKMFVCNSFCAEQEPLSIQNLFSISGSFRTLETRLKVDRVRGSALSQIRQQKVTLAIGWKVAKKLRRPSARQQLAPASVKMENKLVHQFSS